MELNVKEGYTGLLALKHVRVISKVIVSQSVLRIAVGNVTQKDY